MPDLTEKERAALRRKAMELYQSDDLEIDELKNEDVSEADAGYWVRAWVWIKKPEHTVNLELT
jgi:hypothetical protein